MSVRETRAAGRRAIGLLVVPLSLLCGGCSSKDDDKTVAGRSSSRAATVAESVAASGSLRFAQRTEQATERAEASAEVTLVATDASAAFLRFPDGAREERLDELPGGRFGLSWRGSPAELSARFAPGAYAFVLERPGGAQETLSVLARDGLPPAPRVEAPLDLALVPLEPPLEVRWSWEGTGGLFDLTVREEGGEREVLALRDLGGRSVTLPPGSLAPGLRYRLELAAATGPARAAARWTTSVWTLFDVGAP